MKARSIIVASVGLLAIATTPSHVKRQAPELRDVQRSVRSNVAVQRTPGGVGLRGRCAPRMASWADQVQRVATRQRVPGRVVYVLCGVDGSAYRTVLEYEHPISGKGFVSWYPAPRFFGAISARGIERIDLFDAGSGRTGHALVDRQTGRIDFYDESSRWSGQGVVDPSSGEVRRFDVDGRPHERTTLPIPTDPAEPRG